LRYTALRDAVDRARAAKIPDAELEALKELQKVLAMDPGVKRMPALTVALITAKKNLTPEECAPAISAQQAEQLRKNSEKRLSEALERLVPDEQAEEELSQALFVAENVGLRDWKDDTYCNQAEEKLRLVRAVHPGQQRSDYAKKSPTSNVGLDKFKQNYNVLRKSEMIGEIVRPAGESPSPPRPILLLKDCRL
jgi:hypothetical protein